MKVFELAAIVFSSVISNVSLGAKAENITLECMFSTNEVWDRGYVTINITPTSPGENQRIVVLQARSVEVAFTHTKFVSEIRTREVNGEYESYATVIPVTETRTHTQEELLTTAIATTTLDSELTQHVVLIDGLELKLRQGMKLHYDIAIQLDPKTNSADVMISTPPSENIIVGTCNK